MGMDRVSLLERRVDELERELRRLRRLGAVPALPPAGPPPTARSADSRHDPAPDAAGGPALGQPAWAGEPLPGQPPAPRPPAPSLPAVEGPSPAQGRGLEDILGGRVLGWAGAVAVLLGVVFLVAVAIG